MKLTGWRLVCVIVAVAFLFTLGEDHRSCIRQAPLSKATLVREQVLKDFLNSAADARSASVKTDTSLAQKAIDLKAANKYRMDAKRLVLPSVPDCDQIFP